MSEAGDWKRTEVWNSVWEEEGNGRNPILKTTEQSNTQIAVRGLFWWFQKPVRNGYRSITL